ncbi:MAG: hypothetical protein WAM14_02980 [Candidatus Nitrosopolaris sp.]
MFTRRNANKDDEKQKQVERFYFLLKSLIDELFEYAPKSGHVKMPFNVSFGLIHDQQDSILLTGIDQKTGKKMYLYNVRIIGQMFEDKREQMIADKTVDTLFTWIAGVCFLYVRPFVYDYVVRTQHRGKGAADRTTRQIVRGFINKLVNDPELKYVLDAIKG